jgi:hypothetical protein
MTSRWPGPILILVAGTVTGPGPLPALVSPLWPGHREPDSDGGAGAAAAAAAELSLSSAACRGHGAAVRPSRVHWRHFQLLAVRAAASVGSESPVPRAGPGPGPAGRPLRADVIRDDSEYLAGFKLLCQ